MKNFKKGAVFSLLALILLIVTGCNNKKALTEEEQAVEKGMTIEEYRDFKDAAARMNMVVDKHLIMDEDEKDQ